MIKVKEYKNVLKNIDSFNPRMSISQVVRYFQRSGVVFTKSAIQNYVRIELIPPPSENRYYLREHLIMLAIISILKDFYSLDEIKVLLRIMGKDGNLMEVYEKFLLSYKESVSNIVSGLNESDPMLLLNLMACGIALKQTVDSVSKSY